MTLIVFLIVLSLLVLFHECGHFFAARFFKTDVEEFGFGFPPRAAGIKRGNILYSLNWIPLGGFVKIKGESGDSTEDPGSFSAKPLWQRAIILVAGVVMNLLLAVLLFWVGYVAGFPMSVDGAPKGAMIRDQVLLVEQVVKDGPAYRAGLREGQKILSVNSVPVKTFGEFIGQIPADQAATVAILYADSSGTKTVSATTEPMKLSSGRTYGLGVGTVSTGIVSYGFFRAGWEATRTTAAMTWQTFGAFGDLFARLLTGRGVSADLTGPVGIAVTAGQVARLGWVHLVSFAALLSVNLAVLNILPFPALDGGRLLFVAIAKVRGKAVAAKFEQAAHTIGFLLLMLLVLIITFKDLARYGEVILGGIKGLIGL